MKSSQKIHTIFVTLCLLAAAANSTNYGYPVFRSRYQQTPMASSPPLVSGPLPPNPAINKTAEAEAPRKQNKSSSSYFFYYPMSPLPQSRGGKTLNVTLVSESPQEQARILNQPDLYPSFAIPRPANNNVPPSKSSPPIQRFSNDEKGTPVVGNSAPTSPENTPFSPPLENLSNKDKGTPFTPVKEPEMPNTNTRQPKTAGYQPPPQVNKPVYVPPTFYAQKNYGNTNYRYKDPPPQMYQVPTPPPQQNTDQTLPCFCVPYYLCKNGVINSGGRSIAAIRRKGRSLTTYNFTNIGYTTPIFQPKIMSAYVVEQKSDTDNCESNKVCCKLSFAEEEKDTDKYYPVATPLPEPYYPDPPRFPDKPTQYEQCGVRRAYGIMPRLKQEQYPADISEFGEYPWQAAVLRKVEGQKSLYLCGAVLISSQWVTTAAHCVKKEQFSPLLIRLGEWDVNRKDELYPFIEIDVESVLLHPDFNPDTLFNDIALIKMERPVDITLPHVAPACLPKRGTVYEEQKCWVSGWGKDFFGPQGEYQNILKEVDVPVLARDLCNSILRTTNLGSEFTLHPGFLCAGGEAGKDACTGDGGSPLVCISGQKWYVVGLVSWGIGCGQPGVPGIYINMLYYIDWINAVISR